MHNTTKSRPTGISLKDIFSYRNVWMALAIVWVVLFHLPLSVPSVIEPIKKIGYGGVDIFLFASGLGCAFSLNKNTDIGAFFKRRMNSILPMWLLFLPVFLIYTAYASSISIPEILGNVFGLGFIAGLKHQFNWYICAMWVCYLLAPLFFYITSTSRVYTKIATILLLCLFSFAFVGQFELVLWSRLPIFYIGICAAQHSKEKSHLTKGMLWLLCTCTVVGFASLFLIIKFFNSYLWSYGLWWYPFILITPGLVLSVSLACHGLAKTKLKFLIAPLNKLGQHTFSVYLSHILVFDIYKSLLKAPIWHSGAITCLILLSVVAVGAVLLELITGLSTRIYHTISRLFKKTKLKNAT